jgi:hypothetical protein
MEPSIEAAKPQPTEVAAVGEPEGIGKGEATDTGDTDALEVSDAGLAATVAEEELTRQESDQVAGVSEEQAEGGALVEVDIEAVGSEQEPQPVLEKTDPQPSDQPEDVSNESTTDLELEVSEVEVEEQVSVQELGQVQDLPEALGAEAEQDEGAEVLTIEDPELAEAEA